MTTLTRALRTGAWYGDQPFALEFPKGWEVTTHWPDTPPPLRDDQIARALEQPVGQPPIRVLARDSTRPLVILDDLTRTANHTNTAAPCDWTAERLVTEINIPTPTIAAPTIDAIAGNRR